MKILMVLTSHDQLGNHRSENRISGWRSLPAPYFIFREAGVDITIASA
jgi:hypothetical protein